MKFKTYGAAVEFDPAEFDAPWPNDPDWMRAMSESIEGTRCVCCRQSIVRCVCTEAELEAWHEAHPPPPIKYVTSE